ncbi:hypothetical protein M011DRAFT_468168 [Sporormia fimetaria CBS 119925]|uniref:Yippee domain-containing protein n=1 Tax=Sporormia fimetaria CBS 119925 TaxID=1340428 RepID=A0A6A6VAZ1_9PLEO|nr:hypothetical protein M011DRAFT_468168 [Sporormia fimetaria CBS 119925]
MPQPTFPLYLFPSLANFPPFLRRSSTTTTAPPPSSPAKPTHPTSLLSTPTPSHLRCSTCLSDLCPATSILSKGFNGRHGRGYLVSPPPPTSLLPAASRQQHQHQQTPTTLPNTLTDTPEPRTLATGPHVVSNVHCATCGRMVGWKYISAEKESQRYKVGMYILEVERVGRWVGWEGGEDERGEGWEEEEEVVEFDSQDEDECEDLFEGVWTVERARERRREKERERKREVRKEGEGGKRERKDSVVGSLRDWL